MLIRFSIAIFCVACLINCDKKKDKGAATFAQLAVDNQTTTELKLDAGRYTPTVLGLRMIDVRILQELDSTQHPAPIIWYNPECGTATASTTEVGGKEYDYTQSPGCDITKLSTYFDFARPTAEVNAEINSQPNKVYPATYKYVSISWCAGEMVDNNIEYQAEGMDQVAYAGTGGCGQISAEAVPPLEIAEGETVKIALNYSIEGLVSDQGTSSCWTSTDGVTKRCISLPEFNPTASKVSP